MAKRKRRVRSPHPGVKLKRRRLPSGAVSWRAVYTDPNTSRDRYVTLDLTALPTKEARTRWAKNLSHDLARRRMDAAAGVRRTKHLDLGDAIESYLETARVTLKPKTIEGHELATRRLVRWAELAGVRSPADLTPALLADLRDHLVRLPRADVKRGGPRGARVAAAHRRSPVTINREMRSLKTLLNSWRQRGLLTRLHRDDITDGLAALPVPHEAPTSFASSDLRKLLQAALRHDDDTFAMTRTEKRTGHTGRTPRYLPIASFVAVVLLTGARRSEVLALTWEMVDLDALDHDGRTVGEIRIPASVAKTNRARIIGLEVSPALRRILAALRLREGGTGHVFGGRAPYTVDTVIKARRRMLASYGAPVFTWQGLRSTCATYLTNAPGIFGAATVFLSAKQLGHSVAVAERHYLGVHRGIPRDARTLEAAMQIEAELVDVLGAAAHPRRAAS